MIFSFLLVVFFSGAFIQGVRYGRVSAIAKHSETLLHHNYMFLLNF